MVVSIIVPVYQGENYICNIINMINKNAQRVSSSVRLELLLVNDYIDQSIDCVVEECVKSVTLEENVTIITINNEKNLGIHATRVKGLEKSSGSYILFLDQDDTISDNYMISQITKIGDADVIVANGIEQRAGYDKYLYKYRLMQETVKSIWFYTVFDNRIISPGQCLIKKKSIPLIWINNLIKNNGSDDYMLWLLMLSDNRKFAINREILYIHSYTSVNISLNKQIIEKSVLEVLNITEDILGHRRCNLIKRRLHRDRIGKKNYIVSIIEMLNRCGRE